MTLRITNLELALMQGIVSCKFQTGSGGYVWLSKAVKALGSERQAAKTIDSAVSTGLVELETYPDVKDKGIRLTPFAKRVMTAAAKS